MSLCDYTSRKKRRGIRYTFTAMNCQGKAVKGQQLLLFPIYDGRYNRYLTTDTWQQILARPSKWTCNTTLTWLDGQTLGLLSQPSQFLLFPRPYPLSRSPSQTIVICQSEPVETLHLLLCQRPGILIYVPIYSWPKSWHIKLGFHSCGWVTYRSIQYFIGGPSPNNMGCFHCHPARLSSTLQYSVGLFQCSTHDLVNSLQ